MLAVALRGNIWDGPSTGGQGVTRRALWKPVAAKWSLINSAGAPPLIRQDQFQSLRPRKLEGGRLLMKQAKRLCMAH